MSALAMTNLMIPFGEVIQLKKVFLLLCYIRNLGENWDDHYLREKLGNSHKTFSESDRDWDWDFLNVALLPTLYLQWPIIMYVIICVFRKMNISPRIPHPRLSMAGFDFFSVLFVSIVCFYFSSKTGL